MKSAFYVLLGAVFTGAVSLSLGLILFRALRLQLKRGEERLLAFVTGSALLSAIVFALCCTKLARKGVFVAIGLLAFAAAAWFRAYRSEGGSLPPVPRKWKWLAGVVFAAFTVLYFFNAMAPEYSPDGSSYHLVFPAMYYRAHGFVRVPWNMYANLTQGVELLFLFAYAFGRHSAAALVHFTFLAALPWLMISYARRFGFTTAGIAGALFFFASPVVGIDGASAYVDVALAAILFALFYFLQIWDLERDAKLLVPIGILTGFSFATKYTAILTIPYVFGFLGWKMWRAREPKPMLRPLAAVAGLAALFILPWIVKNWMWMNNPVTPFANAIFPNPFIHISFENEYRLYQRIYTLTSYKQVPWQLTVSGYLLCGLFGPLYLLTPFALLAARKPADRQLLLAGGVFALPYLSNVGTRFLIPCAPFLSIALAMAFMNWEWLLIALVAAHAVASWPDVEKLYCSPYAWRLDRIPLRAALRLESEDSFLSRRFNGYLYDRVLEKTVPPDGKIFSFGQIGESYTSRHVLVKYLAAPNEILGDILWTPLFSEFQPSVVVDFQFPQRKARKLRLVNASNVKDEIWSVSEFRVYNHDRELPRDPHWRLTAKPNPWDVQLAFDNSPVTRWRSWQSAEAGMYIEIDFGQTQALDAVRIETDPGSGKSEMRLEAMDESGHWSPIQAHSILSKRPVAYSLRRAAAEEVKARGVRYLLIGYDDLGSEDFQQHASFWGIHLLADAGNTRLYYIE